MEEKTKEKSRSNFGTIFACIIYCLVGAAGAIITISFFGIDAPDLPLLLAGAIVLMLVFHYLHTLLHEWGHFIFGWLTGYRLISFRVGSHIFLKKNGKTVKKRFRMLGTGGQCLMLPPDGENTPYVLFNLGGVIVNAVFAAAAVGAIFFLPDVSLTGFLLSFFAVAGFAAAILNGVPLNLGGITNDAYNVLLMRKDPFIKSLFIREMYLAKANTEGIRLKDMPEECFSLPENADFNNPFVCEVKVLEFSREIDRLNFEAAQAIGEKILTDMPGLLDIHRNEVLCETLFLELVGKRRREEIDKIYTKKLRNYIAATDKSPQRQRQMYTYQLIMRPYEAEEYKNREKFERFAALHPYPGEIENERELMAIADKAAEKAAAAEEVRELSRYNFKYYVYDNAEDSAQELPQQTAERYCAAFEETKKYLPHKFVKFHDENDFLHDCKIKSINIQKSPNHNHKKGFVIAVDFESHIGNIPFRLTYCGVSDFAVSQSTENYCDIGDYIYGELLCTQDGLLTHEFIIDTLPNRFYVKFKNLEFSLQ